MKFDTKGRFNGVDWDIGNSRTEVWFVVAHLDFYGIYFYTFDINCLTSLSKNSNFSYIYEGKSYSGKLLSPILNGFYIEPYYFAIFLC